MKLLIAFKMAVYGLVLNQRSFGIKQDIQRGLKKDMGKQ